jgi:hypothetical protein
MGIIQGLAGLQKLSQPYESDGPKTVWFKIASGQSAQIYFLQELDSSSPRYSEKNGLGLAAPEHSSPANFMVKCLCSMGDEDACYGCEQYRADYPNPDVPKDKKSRWRAKTRLYINVLVKPADGTEPFVAVLSQGFGPKAVGDDIVQLATANGSITDRSFTLKRVGEGRDTDWTLTPSFKEDASFNPEDYEIYDLEKVAVRKVPYAEQPEFFADHTPVAAAAATPSASNIEWN